MPHAAFVGKPQLRLFFAVETTPVIHFQLSRTYIYIAAGNRYIVVWLRFLIAVAEQIINAFR